MSVPNARVKVATLKRHVGRRFALCGTLLWLVAITIEQLRFYALWPFQKGIPLSSLDISTGSFIFFATTAWTTVIIGMMVRLSYNITIPQRGRDICIMYCNVFAGVDFIHIRDKADGGLNHCQPVFECHLSTRLLAWRYRVRAAHDESESSPD